MNKLVDEEWVSAEDAGAMSKEEFDTAVHKIFNTYYSQNFYHPQEISDRTEGQFAEDLVIEELNKLNIFTAEHTAPEEDHAGHKADIILHIPGYQEPVYLQLTLLTDKKVQKKFAKLPEDTIPVVAERVPDEGRRREHPEELAQMVRGVLRQIFDGLRQKPKYRPAFYALWERFEHAQAA